MTALEMSGMNIPFAMMDSSEYNLFSCGGFVGASKDVSTVDMLSSPLGKDNLRRYDDPDSSLNQTSSGSDITASRLYNHSANSGSFESGYDLTDCASNRKNPRPLWDDDNQFSVESKPFNDFSIPSGPHDAPHAKKYRTRRSMDVVAPPAAVLTHPSVNNMGVALGMPCSGPVAMPVMQTPWSTIPAPTTTTPTLMMPTIGGVLPNLQEVLAAPRGGALPIGLKLDCAAIVQELNSS